MNNIYTEKSKNDKNFHKVNVLKSMFINTQTVISILRKLSLCPHLSQFLRSPKIILHLFSITVGFWTIINVIYFLNSFVWV